MDERKKARTVKQLADAIAQELRMPERGCRRFARRFLTLIAEDLLHFGRIELRGLGSFALSTRKARTGHHPKTGQPVQIPETRFVRFRSSVAIRRRLNPPHPKPVAAMRRRKGSGRA